MPMGASLKYFIIYESPFWRSLGKSGAVYTTALPAKLRLKNATSLSEKTVFSCQDHRPFSDARGAMMCWVEGDVNLELLRYFDNNPDGLRDHILDVLRWSFQNDSRVDNPVSIQRVMNWADVPHVGGAYTGFFAPGAQSTAAFWDEYKNGEKAAIKRLETIGEGLEKKPSNPIKNQ